MTNFVILRGAGHVVSDFIALTLGVSNFVCIIMMMQMKLLYMRAILAASVFAKMKNRGWGIRRPQHQPQRV